MKINFIRRSTGKRTTITLPDYLCELWATTRSPMCGSEVKAGLVDLLQQLHEPEPGATFQSLVERTMTDDVRSYQERILTSSDDLKCRVIDWILESLPCQLSPDDKATDVMASIAQMKSIKWEFVEHFTSLEEQRWR
ncbi:hypothetical protein [Lelliottia wanjuensis]|uniref:hypothetical protein n=1 Tax=Lelliottia wanjuensis TaxID=3050585 RepID=UPI00254F9BFB|nr:hypothetical protein [Lelliottia sp. V104_15]MDK9605896.1 hypothetical protein [Lelliottia sp. V104_15]